MDRIPGELIAQFRARTYRLLPGQRLSTPEDAVNFVNERGFIYFWPITGINLPSLWTAVAGDRPVADEHDDPGHVTWGWKDSLLGQRSWYYAKILRKKATMIAMDIVPNFYALSENFGAYDEDYLTQYEQGRLTQEAKTIYEIILDHGPQDTVALRRGAHMTSQASDSRFNRAMADLQADFKIVPVGVTQSGAWHYAFAYDITARQYPEIPEQARLISERNARCILVELYLRSVGAAQISDITKLFGWKPVEIQRTVEQLVQSGVLHQGMQIEDRRSEWIVLASLFG
jgi:hypothetical protein